MKQLGKYEIIELIGKGAYAEVFRAVDTTLDRTVALKLLKPALLADEDAVSRFMREARAAANLIHPRIAWVWEVGELEGRFYIAMRFIEGQPLDQLLKVHGPLPWTRAQEIVQQIGEALSYAHGRGLVHRDVKPQNVLLSKEEGAVLTDFGLVRAMESSGVGTRTGVLMGTPAYMAPEIWRGENAGPAADQYALACILCELLTGQQLFGAANTPAVILRHMQPPQLPEQWPVVCPDNLSEALKRALNPQPEQRFGSIAEFVAAMDLPATAMDFPLAAAPDPGLETPLARTGAQPTPPKAPVDPAMIPPAAAVPDRVPPRVDEVPALPAVETTQPPPHSPNPNAPLSKSPYWPTLIWLALGWTTPLLIIINHFQVSSNMILDWGFKFALWGGVGWLMTGLAIKKRYQLDGRHILHLSLAGVANSLILILGLIVPINPTLVLILWGTTIGIVPALVLRKPVQLTPGQTARAAGGWLLGFGLFNLLTLNLLTASLLILIMLGILLSLIGGAIMIANLEAARKRAARQTEHG